MLTVSWNLDAFLIAEFLPTGETLNTSCFIDNILTPVIQQLQAAHRRNE
jgi:hypothetical protein